MGLRQGVYSRHAAAETVASLVGQGGERKPLRSPPSFFCSFQAPAAYVARRTWVGIVAQQRRAQSTFYLGFPTDDFFDAQATAVLKRTKTENADANRSNDDCRDKKDGN